MIIPSLIAAGQHELEQRFAHVKNCGNTFHLDVMDGKFVDAHSLQFDFSLSAQHLQAHLMIEHPLSWIQTYGHLVDLVFVHIETTRDPKQIIQSAREKGCKIGFALNPESPANVLVDILDDIDAVLVMSVHPGKYGAAYVPQIDKIQALRSQSDLPIYVDGHMDEKTIPVVLEAGATHITVGSALQKSTQPEKVFNKLEEL